MWEGIAIATGKPHRSNMCAGAGPFPRALPKGDTDDCKRPDSNRQRSQHEIVGWYGIRSGVAGRVLRYQRGSNEYFLDCHGGLPALTRPFLVHLAEEDFLMPKEQKACLLDVTDLKHYFCVERPAVFQIDRCFAI